MHLRCMYPLKEIPLLLSWPECTILYKLGLQKEFDVMKWEVNIKMRCVFIKC